MSEPTLPLRLPFLVSWEQDRTGGCRCLCALFHGTTAAGWPPACMSAAEAGLLIRAASPAGVHGPWPVCRACYTSVAPLSEQDGAPSPPDPC